MVKSYTNLSALLFVPWLLVTFKNIFFPVLSFFSFPCHLSVTLHELLSHLSVIITLKPLFFTLAYMVDFICKAFHDIHYEKHWMKGDVSLAGNDNAEKVKQLQTFCPMHSSAFCM